MDDIAGQHLYVSDVYDTLPVHGFALLVLPINAEQLLGVMRIGAVLDQQLPQSVNDLSGSFFGAEFLQLEPCPSSGLE